MFASVYVMNIHEICLYQIPFSSITLRNETLGNTTNTSRICVDVVAEVLSVDWHLFWHKASYNTSTKLPDILRATVDYGTLCGHSSDLYYSHGHKLSFPAHFVPGNKTVSSLTNYVHI
jgi:hypothetical protein